MLLTLAFPRLHILRPLVNTLLDEMCALEHANQKLSFLSSVDELCCTTKKRGGLP